MAVTFTDSHVKGQSKTFGYLIANDILFDINGKKIVNINFKSTEFGGQCTALRDTMARLLVYLIENRDSTLISTDDLLFHVWDQHGLQSSTQRLWQVIQQLNIRLEAIGVPNSFIYHIDKKYYKVRWGFVTPLYF
ncbi:transcriptional regulator [Serratia quinivorans]|uniref:winged helix-turn-helix domain-containing protein n=1 Tax=Serratia quinivorans TaxID=137545 RepID=UPI00217B5158|nr:hypothetical protein [Serratia quinivorans]CAI2136028.1 Uncharacterised protein [Serratia quinivorans]CAI2143404.1 Uncharacterised protein [Serratia quinivorans]